MKKLYSSLLILTPIKKVHGFKKFMSVSITSVAMNNEEMVMKDLASKYFLEVKLVAIAKKPLLIINHILPGLFHHLSKKVLKWKNNLGKFTRTQKTVKHL